VTPEWLLFGTGGAEGTSPHLVGEAPIIQIPVIGKVQFGIWDEDASTHGELRISRYIPFTLNDLELGPSDFREGPSAYSIGENISAYREGSIILVAPAREVGIQDGDHVLTQRLSQDRKAIETTLHLAEPFYGGMRLTPLTSDARRQGLLYAPLDLEPPGEFEEVAAQAKLRVDRGIYVSGVVVGSQDLRRRGNGRMFATR
jgi:hypothetical protein